MATTKIVLLSDSTGSWFYDGAAPTRFFPALTYQRYGKTVTLRFNNSYVSPSYAAEQTVWYGGEGADKIVLFSNVVGGANWPDVDAAAVQACVTDVNPDLVLIALGINGGVTGASGLDALIDDVQAAVPTATVVLLSENPIVSHGGDAQNRDLIQGYAASYGLLFIDMYQAFINLGNWAAYLSDGVHPNDDGKQVQSDTVDGALLSAGLLGPEDGPPAVTVLSNAVAYWKGTTGLVGGVWPDESGNGHDATPVGSPTWDGEKFTLDGATQYFTVPDDPALDVGPAEDLTVVAVVAPSASIAGDGRIVHKRQGGAGSWELYYQHSGTILRSYVSDGTNTVLGGAGTTVAAGPRQTLTMRIIRGSAIMRTGVDGVYVNSGSIAAVGDLSNSVDMFIGRYSVSTSYLKGDVYGVAIFTTALSDAEVEQAGAELVASPSQNRMGGTGAIRKPPRY